MREILFRGKEITSGEWACGSLVTYPSGVAKIVITDEKIPVFRRLCEVIPETVGQYTGLTDKNGKRIFEGDVVKTIYKSNYIGLPDTDFGFGVIEYDDTYYGGASYRMNIIGDIGSRIFSNSVEVEVVGNIHDNPELLQSK